MQELTKSQKRKLRELAGMAYEREQDSLLEALACRFDAWRRQEITGEALNDAVHVYHDRDSRALWKRLNYGNEFQFVAYAVATGVLSQDELPESVRDRVLNLAELLDVADDRVFQFKVALEHVKPPIWRRIRVPADYSFWDLHVAIQDAMGWKDRHLHQFEVVNPKTGARDRLGIPEDGPNGTPGGDLVAGWSASIADYFDEPHTKAGYWYDFGDDWRHTVVLEKVLDPDPEATYPVCTDGRRACPPEDCGGPWGYEQLL